MIKPRNCLTAVVLFCVMFAGCGKVELISVWRDQEIIINGKYTDFGNATAYYDEKEKIAVNLFNDHEYLYICLISRNRQTERQLMESGLIAWFDAAGGKNKLFGIRFPLGMRSMGMSIMEKEKPRKGSDDLAGGQDRGNTKDREMKKGRPVDQEKRLEILEGLQEEMEIITGSDKDSRVKLSFGDAAKYGIEARVGRENGYFVYELKVPLVKSSRHQYAIGVTAGKPVGFGLEIAAADSSLPKEDKPSQEEGGQPPAMDNSRSIYPGENFRFWATIVLAKV